MLRLRDDQWVVSDLHLALQEARSTLQAFEAFIPVTLATLEQQMALRSSVCEAALQKCLPLPGSDRFRLKVLQSQSFLGSLRRSPTRAALSE